MFSGIIEEFGIVKEASKQTTGIRIVISAKEILKDTKVGDSISVNGVCLTVVNIEREFLSFDVVPETVKRTTIGELKALDRVNLERAIKAGQRISGHFITGHIDYKARIIELKNDVGGLKMKIFLPEEFTNFLVEKGSVALDGVSLTVTEIGRNYFSVCLIPHTLKNTTLGLKKKDNYVNIETDILAKYVNKKENRPTFTVEFLNKYGYI